MKPIYLLIPLAIVGYLRYGGGIPSLPSFRPSQPEVVVVEPSQPMQAIVSPIQDLAKSRNDRSALRAFWLAKADEVELNPAIQTTPQLEAFNDASDRSFVRNFAPMPGFGDAFNAGFKKVVPSIVADDGTGFEQVRLTDDMRQQVVDYYRAIAWAMGS